MTMFLSNSCFFKAMRYLLDFFNLENKIKTKEGTHLAQINRRQEITAVRKTAKLMQFPANKFMAGSCRT